MKKLSYKEFIEDWNSRATQFECHTSGSTGTPKTIMLSRKQMELSAQRTIRFFSLNANSHLHSCISPLYIGGKMMAVRAALANALLTWESPSNTPLINAGQEPIDLLAVVPSQMAFILDNLVDLPIIRNAIVGGAAIPRAMHTRIKDAEINAFETYGMTETASHIAIRRAGNAEEKFTPLDGISVTTDNRQCLVIHIDGWQDFHTNDIAEVDESGSFAILGRFDNVIISGSLKIHPEHVEQILEPILGCEVLATGIPDYKWGEKLVLLVDTENQMSDEEISSICKDVLKKEEVPKQIIRRQIPHTSNGKKLRNRINLNIF